MPSRWYRTNQNIAQAEISLRSTVEKQGGGPLYPPDTNLMRWSEEKNPDFQGPDFAAGILGGRGRVPGSSKLEYRLYEEEDGTIIAVAITCLATFGARGKEQGYLENFEATWQASDPSFERVDAQGYRL